MRRRKVLAVAPLSFLPSFAGHWHLWDAILPNEQKFVIWREESEESRTAVLKTVLIDPQRKKEVEPPPSPQGKSPSPRSGGEWLAGTGKKGEKGAANETR